MWTFVFDLKEQGFLVQVGNGIELDTVDHQFKPYLWHSWSVTWGVVPKQSW